ncbi:MAG: hypothetical protein QW794_01740 [Thermosphaera sp.]
MDLQITGESKRELLTKLLLYSSIYGLIHVNYIDLVTPGSSIPGYHLWLICLYFAPFIPVCLVLGFKEWELLVSMGLVASLMNDLFYHPVGNILLGRSYDLADAYAFQLGLRGLEVRWTANFGFALVPVSSLLMAATIYLRVLATALLLRKWWRETSGS